MHEMNLYEMDCGGFLGVRVTNDQVVVSSRDVARVFEKPHAIVTRSIRDLLGKCSDAFGQSNFALTTFKDSQNKAQEEYLLTRDGFTLLAMGYTGDRAMQFKEAYIAEFNRMEGALQEKRLHTRFNIPDNLPDALSLAADLARKKAEAERQVRQLTPKAEAWDATCEVGTDMSLQAIGKEFERLGMGPRKIFDFLSKRGVLYRLAGSWVPVQSHIDNGRFRVKRVNIILHGEPKTVMKTLVTPKGRDFIAGLIGQARGSFLQAVN